jgi:hypothetical protein
MFRKHTLSDMFCQVNCNCILSRDWGHRVTRRESQ